ncbi:unnamed protein product, partial [Scytosiphon promiscuus]
VDTLLPAITEDATCADWAAWIPRRSEPAVVMQQVVSEDYIPIQQNFIRLMERNSAFNRHNLFLMCIDDASRSFFEEQMGFRCVPISALNLPNHRHIWKLRVHVLSCLVRVGRVDVIMSDADALWVNDPTPELSWLDIRDSDVVASRGTFPRLLGEEWGSTICMGFVLFRARNVVGMAAFLSAMEELVKKTGDDQVSINTAAANLGITWEKSSDMRYTESTSGAVGSAFDDGHEEGHPFTVTLLPHSTYTRVCDETPVSDRTVVAHCFAAKKANVKTSWMEALNLWSVENDP